MDRKLSVFEVLELLRHVLFYLVLQWMAQSRLHILFKGRLGGRVICEFSGDNFPQGSVYAVQDKAWVDRRVFLECDEKVWKPYCTNKPSTYLLMDEFSIHIMTELVHAIQDYGTEIDFILGGYTSKLHVHNVGVNKLFKD